MSPSHRTSISIHQSINFTPSHSTYYAPPRHPPHYPSHPQPRHYQLSGIYDNSGVYYDSDYNNDYNNDTASTKATVSHPHRSSRHTPATITFLSVNVCLSPNTARDLDSREILILPSLVHIAAQVRTYESRETVRLAVAAKLRLREVVRQLVGEEFGAKVYVKSGWDWQQFSLETRVGRISHLGYGLGKCERGDVKMKIDLRRVRLCGRNGEEER